MNYVVMIVALVLFILGARFFSANKTQPIAPAPSAVEEMFAPAEDASAKKMREMRENQQRIQSQQQQMQQDRLNTYGTVGQ